MNFKMTHLASMVTASLLFAATSNAANIGSNAFQAQVEQQKLQNRLSAATTYKSLYDENLSVATFKWGSLEQKEFTLNGVEPLAKQHIDAIQKYFMQHAPSHGAVIQKSKALQPHAIHDTGRGGIIGKFKQYADGIEVFGREINVLINRKNQFIASSGYFAPQDIKASNFSMTPESALNIAFQKQTNTSGKINPSIKTAQQSFTNVSSSLTSNGYILTENSRVKPVYFPTDEGKLISAYYVEAETTKKNSRTSDFYSYVIDANTGKVLFRNNLVSHVATTYRVFADSTGSNIPFDGPHGNALTPHPTGEAENTGGYDLDVATSNLITLDHAGLSTEDPWLSEGDTTTSGNNANAYADISGDDGFDADDVAPEMTAANTFDYSFGQFNDGVTGDGQKHAVVNLFYVSNFLHDWFYDSGFDEVSGNAQRSNYGRGGQEGDALRVEAQDATGTDNANMATPSDGSSPRMQMYLWTFLNGSGLEITGVSDLTTGGAGFGPQDYDVTATMIVAEDATDPTGDGCEAITTDVTGKIALIDRGACNFTVKVKNAQDAGAVGVIVINDAADDDPDRGGTITMGGEDDSITIPSLFLSNSNGEQVKTALAADATLEARMFNVSKPVDGTLDNGIVAHEWAHYLTNRLVGNANGLSNNQGRAMGEGWSDFVALLMSVREEDNLVTNNANFGGVYSASSYVGGAYYGIRRVPYSVDMSKNALTFKHIENGVALPDSHPVRFGATGSNNAAVHSSGEIWANMLWEFYVALLNKESYTFAQAQQAMKDYLVASLKLTPNAPTYTEARDAVLAAALANNEEDFTLAKEAFAKRGMGTGAVAPDRTSTDHSGVVEDFSSATDLRATMSIDITTLDASSCDRDGVLDAGETAIAKLNVTSYTSKAIPAFTVSASSDNDLILPANAINLTGLSEFGDSTKAEFEFSVNSAAHLEATELTVQFNQIGDAADSFVEPESLSASLTTNYDFEAAYHSDNMSDAEASNNDWKVETSGDVTSFVISDGAWYGVDSGAEGSSDLTTPTMKVGPTGDFSISFDHFYFFEGSENTNSEFTNWDGGVIEVSVDGGDWQDVVEFGATLAEPYNGTITSSNSILGGREGYVYTRDPDSFYLDSNSITFPDGLVNNSEIQVRFRIGTDEAVGDYGWLIDNVVVTNALEPMFSQVVEEDGVCLSANAPVVSAGTDMMVTADSNPTLTVNLSGTATDADNDTLTYQWTQVSGDSVTIDNATMLNASFTMDTPATSTTMTFKLEASDGGFTVSDFVNVSIDVNNIPTVTVSGTTSVQEKKEASLTATGSDADGDSLTYSWTQTSGPSVTLSSTTSSTVSFTAPSVSEDTTLTFSVTVSDGVATSAAATANVQVTNKKSSGSVPLSLLLIFGLFLGIRRLK